MNWNGGDVKFSNIGTIDAYSRGSTFMIQSSSENFPSLIFEDVDTVNIHSSTNIGIQIAASSDIDQSKQYTPLNVSNVNNFNVYGAATGMEITNKLTQKISILKAENILVLQPICLMNKS